MLWSRILPSYKKNTLKYLTVIQFTLPENWLTIFFVCWKNTHLGDVCSALMRVQKNEQLPIRNPLIPTI